MLTTHRPGQQRAAPSEPVGDRAVPDRAEQESDQARAHEEARLARRQSPRLGRRSG